MLRHDGDRERGETKNSNLTTKILPGHVERRVVRCGKSNCKCRRGEPHGFYYYLVITSENLRFRRYIPLADVAWVMQACENHRQLQAELRAGRQQYKSLLSQARALLGGVL